jgi:LytS/YehU family sensor histidine kinase
MLEGYDLGWKDTYDRQATYSSLPPGKYSFRVRSSLDQSFRNASEVSYGFSIRGPFWASAWFISLIILMVSVIAYFVIRNREKRFRRIEQQKKEKVEFEFQVLKNQVNPHFLFNSFSTLMSLIEEQPEQAMQYTEKLSDFFRIILQYKDQELISLNEELSLIESYFFLVKKRFGDNINLEISLEENLKKTFIPPMTLQILLENCVKHNIISKDKPLFIRIYEDKGRIVVENNLQPKMMNEISTGIGLENIRKRYRLINKVEPVIEKTEGLFRVRLPGIMF